MNSIRFFCLSVRFWLYTIFIESVENFWRNILFGFPKAKLPESLKDKTVVITGANRGIGLATVKVFVQLGAKVCDSD